jgi:hypothetical protein
MNKFPKVPYLVVRKASPFTVGPYNVLMDEVGQSGGQNQPPSQGGDGQPAAHPGGAPQTAGQSCGGEPSGVPSGGAPHRSVVSIIRIIVPYTAAALAIGVVAFVMIASHRYFGSLSDFPQYNAAARLMASGKAAEVYDTASLLAVERALHPDLQRPVAMFVPPPAALLFLPIAMFPQWAAFGAWTATLSIALAVTLYLLKREMQLPAAGFGWLMAAVVFFGPTFEALRISQPATIMLLALTGASLMARQGRDFQSGLCLGMLLLKPQELLPLGLFLLGARQWQVIGGLAAATAVLTLISLPVFGVAGYQNYVQLILDPTSADFMQSAINPTVRGQLALIFEIDSPITKYGALAAMALAYIACLVAGIKSRSGDPFYVMLTAAVPIGLVTAWHCHFYDLVLVIPGVVALFMTANRREKAVVPLLVILGSLPFMVPIYVPLHFTYLLRGGMVNPYFFLLAIYSVTAMGCFLIKGSSCQAASAASEPPAAA